MSKKLYVSNLAFGMSDSSLEELFQSIGQVLSAKVITDRVTGRSKGFGFVEMSSPQEADDAIAKLNGKEVQGRLIGVAEARPQQARDSSGGGHRGGGGSYDRDDRGGRSGGGFGRPSNR